MSRYELQENYTDYFIIDNETGDKWLFKQDIAEVMNQQDKKIKELKEDLKHCNKLRKLEVEKNNNYHNEKYALDKPIEEIRKLNLSFPEKEWYIKGFDNCERQFASHIADLTLKIKELEQQLKQKFEDMPMTDFIRMAKKNGYEVQSNEDNSKQLAIEELEKLKQTLKQDCSIVEDYFAVISLIDKQIKELRGEK